MKLLTPKDIAEQIGLKADTVQRYIREGRIRGRAIAGVKRKRYVVTQEDFEAFLESEVTMPQIEEAPQPRVYKAGFPLLEKYGYRKRV